MIRLGFRALAAVAVAALALLAVAGCTFHVEPIEDASAPAGEDLAAPADFAGTDLQRNIPDGAVPRGNGYPCDFTSDCDSGSCVDGYCCESLCDPGDSANLCKACNVPGFEGRCVAAQAGTDPHQQCEPDPMASCGKDGLCDGAGACRKYVAGTVCGSSSCTANMLTFAPACDGNGTCVASGTVACAPYACANATVCATSCTPPATGCTPPAMCDPNGSCGKRGQGQPCTLPGDCASSFCANGVCCDSACGTACHACNIAGKVGVCSPVAAGTQCAAAACSGDSTVSKRTCNAAGTCQPAITASCSPYSCNAATAACFARPCANSTQCASGHSCAQGSQKCL